MCACPGHAQGALTLFSHRHSSCRAGEKSIVMQLMPSNMTLNINILNFCSQEGMYSAIVQSLEFRNLGEYNNF